MMIDAIRRARVEDLGQVYDIFYEAEVGDDANPPRRGIPSFLKHELETGEMYVVEKGRQIVAFAVLITRSSITYLAEFFVRKNYQSAGIGKMLLQHILPRDGRICCTLSSRDPRALALYLRAGMRPQWPNFWLRIDDTAHLGELPISDIEIVEGQANDPAFVCWDVEISGLHRPQDHAYWIREAHAMPVWFQRKGQIVGYGYIQMRSPGSLWYPDSITLGPIGTRTADDALDCVCAAVRWAQPHAEMMRITVPGPHPVLAPFLDAGFRIIYVETFVSSSSEAFVDVRRYIPSGLFL